MCVAALAFAATPLREGLGVLVQPASDEPERTRKALQLPAGVRAELWAAHPLLGDPVAISFDGHGRLYVTEHHRNRHGTEDNREHRYWVDDDAAAKTIEDRLAFMEKWAAAGKRPMSWYTEIPDRLLCVEDRDGDGRAETSRVLATFSEPLDGANVGVLARDGEVWVTCIPHLWKFRDNGRDEPAPAGERVFTGFGTKFTFHGHDMHGLVQGPDGRIYWSIGDRGYHVRTREGKILADAWRGAVFRCEPDGSKLEVFCTGLRNPQELVFDDLGNLITVDNDNDASDEQPRLLHLVEGGDYGWHGGNLFVDDRLPPMAPTFRRPWFEDGLWKSRFDGQPAWVMPPVAHVSNGPCGLAREPGVTLLPERWRGAFLLTDWRGGRASPVIAFKMEPRGNGFAMTHEEDFLNGIIPTDVEFGPDGRLYVADMVAWETAPGGGRRAGRGSIFALSSDVSPSVRREVETMRGWFKQGFTNLPATILLERLAHADYRVRLEAQLALAKRSDTVDALLAVTLQRGDLRARVHALQALGQVHRRDGNALSRTLALFQDAEPEMRAQLARQLADTFVPGTFGALVKQLQDSAPRARFYAALALGRLGDAKAIPALADMVRSNRDDDVYLRHAAVMAFTRFIERGAKASVFALQRDASVAVRRIVLLAQRRTRAPEMAGFLRDADPSLVREAVRAIHDLSFAEQLAEVAALSEQLAFSDDATGRRVLNARFRLGRPEDAEALARVATRADVSVVLRREALALLAEWEKPFPRDRVTGEWAPLPDRSEAPAITALRAVLPTLIREGSAEVAAAAVGLAGRYRIAEGVEEVLGVARDLKQPDANRAAAAKALVFVTEPRVVELARMLVSAGSPGLRSAGRDLLWAQEPELGLKEFGNVFTNGTLGEQQAAISTLGTSADRNAFALLALQAERVITKKLPVALALDFAEALERAARITGLPSAERTRREQQRAKFQAAWLALFPETDRLREHRAALEGGDALRGRELFHTKVEYLCTRCHKAEGAGTSDVGPDLTGVATRRSRESLLRAMVDPGAEIAPGFEYATVTLQSGETASGQVLSESEDALVLKAASEGQPPVTVRKSNLKERVAASAMPPLVSLMSPRELRDLVEYLATQK